MVLSYGTPPVGTAVRLRALFSPAVPRRVLRKREPLAGNDHINRWIFKGYTVIMQLDEWGG